MPPETLITLTAGDYALTIAPAIGGSLQRFDWRGEPVLRRATGPGVLDAASFPMVPFCNRIAGGGFTWQGKFHRLASNLPGGDYEHPLHGYGWVNAWSVAEQDRCSARLVLDQPVGDGAEGQWPWPYRAEQTFTLTPAGLVMSLSVTHLGPGTMPAGLGFHPYFPIESDTVYHGLHHGEWQTGPDVLPRSCQHAGHPRDWWDGAPVRTRVVDTIYEERVGPLRLTAPARDLLIELLPSDKLACTGVYVVPAEGYVCIEPQSHATDAINRRPETMRSLAEGETLTGRVEIRAARLSASAQSDSA